MSTTFEKQKRSPHRTPDPFGGFDDFFNMSAGNAPQSPAAKEKVERVLNRPRSPAAVLMNGVGLNVLACVIDDRKNLWDEKRPTLVMGMSSFPRFMARERVSLESLKRFHRELGSLIEHLEPRSSQFGPFTEMDL